MRLNEILKRQSELKSQSETLKGDDLEKCLVEMRALNEEKQEIEKRSAIAGMLSEGSVTGSTIEKPVSSESTQSVDKRAIYSTKEYRSAYFKRLLDRELSEVEKRALTTANNSAGAVVPTQTMNMFIERIKTFGKVLPMVTQMNIPSNISMPIEGTINDASWVTEGSATTDANDTYTNVLTLGAFKLIKTLTLTAELKEMSIDAFEGFIVQKLYEKVEKALENAVINGNGTTQAQGILTMLNGDATNEIETATVDTLDYDDLQDQDALLPEGYEDRAVYVMNKNTLRNRISKIKDTTKQPIFKVETDDKGNKTKMVNGYPVILTSTVPDDVVILGDFSQYYLNIVKSFEITKDESVAFRSGDTCYRILGLADGKPALKEAFVVLKVKPAPAQQ